MITVFVLFKLQFKGQKQFSSKKKNLPSLDLIILLFLFHVCSIPMQYIQCTYMNDIPKLSEMLHLHQYHHTFILSGKNSSFSCFSGDKIWTLNIFTHIIKTKKYLWNKSKESTPVTAQKHGVFWGKKLNKNWRSNIASLPWILLLTGAAP